MQIAVKSMDGKEVKKVDLPDSIFAVELNDHVLHHVVKAYQANRRQGTHATKTRAFVSGGGKKPFRQKGTGNARQGTSRSPHYPGGAVSHGPQPRDYTQKLNKKTRLLALKVALSDKVKHGQLVIVDDYALDSFSTKKIVSSMAALNVKRATFTDAEDNNFLYKSARNINGAAVKKASELNAEDVLRYESFVMSEKAIAALTARLEGDK
ncbi:MAG: 50S ribosomal protein L4 [Pseudobacteriovorax sp.]|nr:50S ribosomal protein L4 [Pseudobacteriovorax sp.]